MFKALIEKDQKLREITAEDLMVDVPYLHPEMRMSDAGEILRQEHKQALPVVLEGTAHVVGIISEKDIIRFLYDLEKYENPYGYVKNYMTTNLKNIYVTHTLYEILSFFLKTNIKAFPVIKSAEIVGVVYRYTIINYVSQIEQDFK